MNFIDEYRLYVSAYYGIEQLDEYDLKEYIMEKIKKHVVNFIKTYNITSIDYSSIADEVKKDVPFKIMLKDALIVLPIIGAPLELSILIKQKLNDLSNND